MLRGRSLYMNLNAACVNTGHRYTVSVLINRATERCFCAISCFILGVLRATGVYLSIYLISYRCHSLVVIYFFVSVWIQ
jgi:hypothetical protein